MGKRDRGTEVELTPTELQVAQLVQQGLSNREVAAQLFVSPRTVDFHLRNVFAKSGITSRGALTRLQLTRPRRAGWAGAPGSPGISAGIGAGISAGISAGGRGLRRRLPRSSARRRSGPTT